MRVEDTVQEYLDTMRLMGKEVTFVIDITDTAVIANKISKDMKDYTEDIIITDFITEIGEEVFKGMKKVKKIVLHNSVNSIGDEAFRYCESLQEINIPNSVTSIGDKVFRECKSLKEITLPLRFNRDTERLGIPESCTVTYI